MERKRARRKNQTERSKAVNLLPPSLRHCSTSTTLTSAADLDLSFLSKSRAGDIPHTTSILILSSHLESPISVSSRQITSKGRWKHETRGYGMSERYVRVEWYDSLSPPRPMAFTICTTRTPNLAREFVSSQNPAQC